MAGNIQVGIIGLGKFGLSFGVSLIEMGHQVLGIDKDTEKVKRAQHILTNVYQADNIDKTVLSQIGFKDLVHALVSVGESITDSTMIAMYLKELDIQDVWVKAVNEDHKKLLNKIGVNNVIIPEQIAASQLANRLAIPGFIDYLPFDREVVLKEITIHEWAGKSLRQVNLSNRFNAQVIAIKKANENKFRYIPKADDIMTAGDILVVIGNFDMLSKIKP
jgi:trk system potassium uptake protein